MRQTGNDNTLACDTDLGYAYAAPYRPRSAYRHTLEKSVYDRWLDTVIMQRDLGFTD